MKFKIMTRDYKGIHDHMGRVRGWLLFGGEDEIDTRSDSQALIFCDCKCEDKSITPQEIYDINEALYEEDVVSGYKWVENEDDAIEKV